MSDTVRVAIQADQFSFAPLFIPPEAFTGITSRVVIRRDQIEAIELNDEFVTIRYKKTDD